MEFTINSPKLCIFCYKRIQLECYNEQNTAKVNTFCVNLSRLLDCQNNKLKHKKLFANSFVSCSDCEILTTEFTGVYHQIKCLELQLLWKLEKLGKVIKMADKVPSRVARMKRCFEKLKISNIGSSETYFKDFRMFRRNIRKQCDFSRIVPSIQPQVLLKRLDQSSKLPCPQVLASSLEPPIPPMPFNDDSNFILVREWTITFAFVLYLLTSSSTYISRINDYVVSISMDPSTDDGSDEIVLDVKTSHETIHSNVEDIFEDVLQERLPLDSDTEEPTTEAEQMNKDNTQLNITATQFDEVMKTEHCDNEHHEESEEQFEDNFSSPTPSSVVHTKLEVSDKSDENIDALHPVQEIQAQETTFADVDETRNYSETGNTPHCSLTTSNESVPIPMLIMDRDDNSDNFNPDLESPIFVCEILNCMKIFRTSADLLKHHMFDIHQESVSTTCEPKCANKEVLRNHKACHNNSEKPWKCPQCGKGFKIKDSLTNHAEIHKHPAEWKFQCPTCGQKFVSKGFLNRHLKVHTHDKTWECKQCGDVFGTEEQLKTHLVTHDKPWVCKYCGERFAFREQWLSHALNVHLQSSDQL